MRTLSLSAAATLAVAAATVAPTQAQVLANEPSVSTPPAIAEAWQRFLTTNESGPAWRAYWSRATGTPVAIWGPGLPLPGGRVADLDAAREHAEATRTKYADLIGAGSSTYLEKIAGKMNRTFVFVYQQQFRGLEVIGGRADVRIHDIGRLVSFGAQAFQVPADFSIAPRVAPTVARATAYAERQVEASVGLRQHSPERLVIWGDARSATRSSIHLAWEVTVHGGDQYGHAFVDAKTGKFLHWNTLVHDCGFPGCRYSVAPAVESEEIEEVEIVEPVVESADSGPFVNVRGKVMVWANTGLGPNDPLQNVPAENIRVQVAGGNVGFTDAQGDFDIPHSGTAPVNVTVTFTNSRHVGTSRANSGATLNKVQQVTPGTPATIQIYSANPSVDERALATSYYWTDQANQFLRQPHIIPTTSQGPLDTRGDRVRINVGVPGVCNAFYNTGQNSTNYFNAGSGCVNTAYSTVVCHEWGHGLDNWYGGISQADGLSEGWADIVAMFMTGDPIVGKDFQGPGRHVRTGLNSKTYPPGGFPSGGAPHPKGEVWMGGSWDARRALMTKYGNTFGARIAEGVILGSIIANASDQTRAVLQVFIADDDDGNLNNGTPNCQELFGAYVTKRKIPRPVNQCGTPAGTFTSYGTGCAGSGSKPAICATLNGNGGTLSSFPLNNEYAYPIRVPQAGAIIGAQLFTTQDANASVNQTAVNLYRTSFGQPSGIVIATGTLTASKGNARFYSVRFDRQPTVAANEIVWIGQADTSNILAPNLSGGTRPVNSVFRKLSSGQWITSSAVQFPALRLECGGGSGSAIPELSAPSGPNVNQAFQMVLSFAKATTPAVFIVGGSRTTWSGQSLPFDLTGLGAPGCSLLASVDVPITLTTDAVGSTALNVSLPNNPWLLNQRFYNQVIVLDVGNNGLGISVSNGAEAKIGR